MKSQNHTSGSWRANKSGTIQSQSGQIIAETIIGPLDPARVKECRANAELIARVPELLMMAEKAEANFRAILALCDNPHFDTSRKYRIAELASEAIAFLSK